MLRTMALGFMAVVIPSLVMAQAPDPWVGKRVFTRYGTVLKVGDQVVDDAKRSDNFAVSGRDRRRVRVYRVEQTNGPWLWLAAEKEGVRGWVQAGDVIPVEQAVDYYTDVIRVDPSSSAYTNRGLSWHEKGEYDIAIGDYNEAIRLDPRNEAAYNNRGIAWSAKTEYDKALADYGEAIRLDPRYASAYHNRGLAWSAKTEYDKALADYGEAIRLDPKDASAYYNRGLAWYDKKEYDKAMADYGEAIRLDPKDASAYYNRGRAWSAKTEYDKALADYGEAIRLDPKDASAYNNRAWLMATCPEAKARDGKKAVDSATRACELSEWKDANHLDTLAAACAEAGDFDAAVKWQEKAQGLYSDPKDKEKGLARLELYRAKKPYRQTPGSG